MGQPAKRWKAGPDNKSPSPVESHRTHFTPQLWAITTHVKCCLPGKLIRDSACDFYWWKVGRGAGPPRHLCLPCTKISAPRGENQVLAWIILFGPLRQSESLLPGDGGDTSQTQILPCQLRASLASRPSKESSFRLLFSIRSNWCERWRKGGPFHSTHP